MIVHAGDEGVTAFDPMYQLLLTQKVESTINSNRRRPRCAHRQPVNQFISTKGLMARQQCFQDPTSHRRQSFFTGSANRFRMSDGVACATMVVVTGLRKYRVRD